MTWTVTAFLDHTLWATGPVEAVVEQLRTSAAEASGTVLIFDDRTGKNVDFDTRGTAQDVQASLRRHPLWHEPSPPEPRRRGRPKLGVISRELSLLPRHWAWLAAQRGSASAVVRRLIDVELKKPDPAAEKRHAVERIHNFLWALGGDLPHFEEATRALFAGDFERFSQHTESWPGDVIKYVDRLKVPVQQPAHN